MDSAEVSEVLKLLLLIPRIVRCSWASTGSSARATVILRTYPYLDAVLGAEVCAGLQTAPEASAPSDPDKSRTKAAETLLARGFVSKANRILMSEGTASLTPEVIADLHRLHPAPAEPHDEAFELAQPHYRALPKAKFTPESLIALIQSLPNDSGGGFFGWTFGTLKLLIDKSAHEAHNNIRSIHRLCFALAEGEPTLAGWLTDSRLLALKKPHVTCPRPIAVGECFTRVAAVWSLRTMPDIVSYPLLPCQFGVCTPGGVEPVIFGVSSYFASADATYSLGTLDFSNAFNRLSRAAIITQVQKDAPEFLPLVTFLYANPSMLLARTPDNGFTIIESRTGVRQGDPLAPFLFSLAVKPLLQELVAHLDDPQSTLWAYLDDIQILCRDYAQYQQILEFFLRDDVKSRYGLVLNPTKCKFITPDEMRTRGTMLLGTWVGGPCNNTNEGAALLQAASDTLVQRLARMQDLSAQSKLLVLRLCDSPRLVHLIRTMHPDIVRDGCGGFDRAVANAVKDIAGVLTLDDASTSIIRLPTRMGGLGMFSQQDISSRAFGSSFALSQRVLRDRDYDISPEFSQIMAPHVEQCALSIGVEPEAVLEWAPRDLKGLQRRSTEVLHHREFQSIFDQLEGSTQLQVQFIENGSPLAYPWIGAPPTNGVYKFKDDELRYALRSTLLIPLHPLNPADLCMCGCLASHRHHHACRRGGPTRTRRHNQIRASLGACLRTGGYQVSEEKIDRGARHDLEMDAEAWTPGSTIIAVQGAAATRTKWVGDVCVAAVPTADDARIIWPLDPEIDQAALLEQNRVSDTDFHWENHDREVTGAEVYRGRAFRRLCASSVSQPAMKAGEARKEAGFKQWSEVQAPLVPQVQFVPLLFTSGGAMSTATAEFLRKAMRNIDGTRKQVEWRKFVRRRLSITLIKHAFYCSRLVNH
jgi:hypothetical protein